MQPNDSPAQPHTAYGQPAHGDQPTYGEALPPPPYGSTSPTPYGQTSQSRWPTSPPHGQAPHGQAPHGQAPHGQAPYGQAPYAPATVGQVPHAPPQYGPPDAYRQPQPPPYLQQTDAARVAKLQKGKRDVVFGAVWLVFGLLITGITMSSGSPVYILAWGPMLYGIYKIIRGVAAISANNG